MGVDFDKVFEVICVGGMGLLSVDGGKVGNAGVGLKQLKNVEVFVKIGLTENRKRFYKDGLKMNRSQTTENSKSFCKDGFDNE